MKIKANFILLGLLLLLSACASFPGSKLPEIEKLSSEQDAFNEPDKNKLNIAYSYLYGTDPKDESRNKKFEDEFIATFNEHESLSLVNTSKRQDSPDPFIKVEVQLTDSISTAAIFSAFIAGLSADIIPTWETRTYTVTAKITAMDGKVYKYKLIDSMKTVRWLPMVVVSPMKNMFRVSKNIRQNMWRNLLLNMQEDKILNTAD